MTETCIINLYKIQSMKIRTFIFLFVISICSALAWGQTWDLSPTMKATLDNNVMTISTTLAAEAMPASAWPEEYRGQIHSLVIEDGVTSIGSWAFAHHSNLVSVTMANSVTIIDSYAFYNCGSLSMITIPEGVTTLEHAAFKMCGSLKEIDIPASVTSIKGEMFVICGQLEAIHVHADNPVFSSDKGILYDKDKTTLIIYPEGKSETSFEIPVTVEKIEGGAFYDSRFESISIPNAVTGIGMGAFQSCNNLTSILIPASVEDIGAGAFAACEKLTSIEVATENKTYTSEAGILYSFDKTLLHTYPAGISGDFTVPSDVKTIGTFAFSGCSLLTSVTMPNTVTAIGEVIFGDCSNLESVTLSTALTAIPGWAFSKCYKLTSITIPNSVIEIGQSAFEACTSLTEVTVGWETPLDVSSVKNIFLEVNTPDVTLFVPAGTSSLYQLAYLWMDFAIVEYDFTGNEPLPARRDVASYVSAWTQNGILYIAGLMPGQPLYLYNLAGQLLYSGIAKAGEVQIPLAWRGACVVVAGEQRVKVFH